MLLHAAYPLMFHSITLLFESLKYRSKCFYVSTTLLWGIFFLSLLATFFPFFLRYWSNFPEDFNFLNFSASSNFFLSAVGKDKRTVNDCKVVNYNCTVYLQFSWSARMKLKKNHQENHQRPPRTKLKKKRIPLMVVCYHKKNIIWNLF